MAPVYHTVTVTDDLLKILELHNLNLINNYKLRLSFRKAIVGKSHSGKHCKKGQNRGRAYEGSKE